MESINTWLEGKYDRFAELAPFYADGGSGGAALIMTGGFAPNMKIRLNGRHHVFAVNAEATLHRNIKAAIHESDGHILPQLLH